VTALLGLGAMANTRNRFNHTALMFAAANGHTMIIKELLPYLNAAAINSQNIQGMTALMYAAKYGYDDVVIELLNRLSPVGIIHAKNNQGKAALTLAVINGHEEVVKKILNKLEASDFNSIHRGRPELMYLSDLLMYALKFGHSSIVKILLTKLEFFTITERSIGGLSVLEFAVINGYMAIVEMFLEKLHPYINVIRFINPAGYCYKGRTLLMHAAENGQAAIVEKLLNILVSTNDLPKCIRAINYRNPNDITALMFAAAGGYTEVVKKFLAILNTPILLNEVDDLKRTALMHAAIYGHTAIIAELLIVLNADEDINLADKFGKTALMHAAANGHLGIVALLLTKLKPTAAVAKNPREVFEALITAVQYNQAPIVTELLAKLTLSEINEQNEQGLIALIFLAAQNNSIEIIALLLNKLQAETAEREETFITALRSAASSNQIEVIKSLLIQSRVKLQNKVGIVALKIMIATGKVDNIKNLLANLSLSERVKLINLPDENGYTALMNAVKWGETNVVSALLSELSARDLLIKNKQGRNVLMVAVQNFKIENEPIIDLLLTKLKDTEYFNLKDNEGHTALMLAIKRKDDSLIRKLINQSTNINYLYIKNNYQQTVIMLAAQQRDNYVLRAILEKLNFSDKTVVQRILQTFASQDLIIVAQYLLDLAHRLEQYSTDTRAKGVISKILNESSLDTFENMLEYRKEFLRIQFFKKEHYPLILGALLVKYRLFCETELASLSATGWSQVTMFFERRRRLPLLQKRREQITGLKRCLQGDVGEEIEAYHDGASSEILDLLADRIKEFITPPVEGPSIVAAS
ncbi:MAG: hypothetical protein A3E87_00045, partial [Gammaproteobacteria bacterium RIFCSPHIGHO2_12_FULL_35_23]